MNKKFTKLIAALALLLLVLPPMWVMGQTYIYELATSLSVGDEVVIVNTGLTKELTSVSNNLGNPSDITGGTISGINGTYILSVEAGYATDTWSFKNGSNYLAYTWTGDKNNYLTTSTSKENTSSWTVSFNSSNQAIILNCFNTERKLQFNSDRFCCYKSNQTAIKIYKRVEAKVVTPQFAPPAGSYASAQDVEISTTTTGATIYYTTDGSTPTTNSSVYSSAINVSSSMTIKAFATKSGLTDSDVAEATYSIVQAQNLTINSDHGTVTVFVNNETIAPVGGVYSIPQGATVNLSVTPSNGYAHSGWTVNSGGITVANNSFTMPANAVSLTANYEEVIVDELTNVLVNAAIGSSSQSGYKFWEGVSPNIAVYAGNTYNNASNNLEYIQLRNNSDPSSGIVTTASGGYAKKVMITFVNTSNSTSGRTITVYGKNTPYEGPADLYDNQKCGTSLGTITCGSSSSTEELTISGDYLYIGLKASGALYCEPITITWLPLTFYGITYQPTYLVDDVQVGSVTVSPKSSIAGQTVTITATGMNHYHFNGWEVLDEDDQPIALEGTNPATFVMPSKEVFVDATFEEDEKVTITYSENGSTIQDDVYLGEVTLEASPVTTPANMSFYGWATSAVTKFTDEAPTKVTSYNVTAPITFYAVYKYDYSYDQADGTFTWEKVTNVNSLAADDKLVIACADHDVVAGNISNQIMPEVSASFSSGGTILDDLPDGAVVLTLGGSSGSWTLSNSSGQKLGATAVKKLAWDNGTTTWSISFESGRAKIQNSTNSYGFFCHNYTNNSERFTTYTNITSGAQMHLPHLYKAKTNIITISGSYYLTSVTEIATATPIENLTSLSNNVTINPTTGSYSVNGTLNANGYLIANGQTERLVVNNGGQLIANNDGVFATLKKTVAQHGATTTDGGWNFIASPIAGNIDPTTAGLVTDELGTTATSESGTYDLYRFVQNPVLEEGEGYEWKNYRKNNFMLSNGAGYLYASKNGVTLSFAGDVVPGTADGVAVPLEYAEESATTDMTFRGWNLVGNPFTFNAAVDMAYYTLDANGTVIPNTTTQAIVPPCTSIMVYVNETGQSITFSKPLEGSAPSNGNVNIAVMQANERGASATTVDKAIVSFNEGNELPKFYFGNANANLYIPQNDKEYAILSAEAQGEMPLNFRANTDGQYTLTVNPEGVEMNYLHLVDNMTGNDVDLLATPSYTFNATTRDYESRFRLVFAANNENGVSASSTTFAFYSNGNWMVNNEGEATLQVIDVMGRVLSNQTISGTAELSLNQQPGVYVLRLVNGNDVKTQKIVVR